MADAFIVTCLLPTAKCEPQISQVSHPTLSAFCASVMHACYSAHNMRLSRVPTNPAMMHESDAQNLPGYSPVVGSSPLSLLVLLVSLEPASLRNLTALHLPSNHKACTYKADQERRFWSLMCGICHKGSECAHNSTDPTSHGARQYLSPWP